MKIDTQIQSQYKIQNKLKEHIKDRINERMEKHIKNIKNKNKIKIHTSNTIFCENFNKLMNHVSDNQTELTADSNSIKDIYNNTALENFKNSSDYEEMWNIAIDKWSRNWNFYREHLTNSILEKFQLNNKRQKRQTKEDYIELTGQNINGSAIGPQDIFIEHYDCDAEEITNVKYYELNKISTCKFKPLDLDMTKTEVQLLSKAQAVEIKAYAVAGTIKERVEWCSQHTNYIRANRPSYYVSDAQRTKTLEPEEVRNELARLNLDTEEISYMGTKLPCDLRKGECQPTPFAKATIVWEPQTHCQLFELIRFDAFMVKYQDRYWIETNAEWTTVQKPDRQEKITLNKTASIAARFEIYQKVEPECGSIQPLHKTEYDDIYIIYGNI